VEDPVSLAQSDKLYIKSITKSELKHVNTVAEYMLDKDDCLQGNRRRIVQIISLEYHLLKIANWPILMDHYFMKQPKH
jgi:hypothetical protein